MLLLCKVVVLSFSFPPVNLLIENVLRFDVVDYIMGISIGQTNGFDN